MKKILSLYLVFILLVSMHPKEYKKVYAEIEENNLNYDKSNRCTNGAPIYGRGKKIKILTELPASWQVLPREKADIVYKDYIWNQIGNDFYVRRIEHYRDCGLAEVYHFKPDQEEVNTIISKIEKEHEGEINLHTQDLRNWYIYQKSL